MRQGRVKLPGKSSAYRYAVHVDWLSMLYQRHLFTAANERDAYYVSQFGADASPQGPFEYLNTIEERFVFQDNAASIAKACSDHGVAHVLVWERRTLAPHVLGWGNTWAAVKFVKFAQVLQYETPPELQLQRRESVCGFLADQGTDILTGDFPHCDENIEVLMAGLRSGELDWSQEAARRGYYLPNSVTVPEHLHINFNALQEALVSSKDWKPYETVLRLVVLVFGSKMFRDRFVALCMPRDSTSREDRQFMHTFQHHSFDWRWEVLEELVVQLVVRWEVLRRYMNRPVLTNDGDLKSCSLTHMFRALDEEEEDTAGFFLHELLRLQHRRGPWPQWTLAACVQLLFRTQVVGGATQTETWAGSRGRCCRWKSMCLRRSAGG